MNLSAKDYLNLYQLQDKVFKALSDHFGTLYLTGGTALGRFYLNHRYSEDIDLFANADISFKKSITDLRNIIESEFKIGIAKPVLYNDFIRLWIEENNFQLKIEFVNDVSARWGGIFHINNIPIDNPGNILANKLTAVVGRDEPKDVFDIITISRNYSFNWAEVFEQSVRKAIVAEQNVAERLATFPFLLLEGKTWLFKPVDQSQFMAELSIISDDFLFARDNSLGKEKIHIMEARPFSY